MVEKQNMKLAFFSLLFVCACGVKKDSKGDDQTDWTVETPPVMERIIGTVHTSETECPVFIEAIEKGDTFTLYPINLDDRFKVDGMRLKFAYHAVKAPQPSTCNTNIAAELSDVTPLR